MNMVKLRVFIIMTILSVLATNVAFADDKAPNKEGDEIFQALDKNHDSKISKEEWNAVDTNKDNQITPDEWQRYHFSSSKTLKWFDNNGDLLMDRDEFMNNFK